VLYLPHVYALDNESVAAVRRYWPKAAPFGRWPVGWKTITATAPEIPGGLVDVFGVKVAIAAYAQRICVDQPRCQAGRWWISPTLCGAEAIERTSTGSRRHPTSLWQGHGHLLRHGVDTGYHRHPDPQAGQWIAAPARRAAREMAVSAATKAPRVFFRGMKCRKVWSPF